MKYIKPPRTIVPANHTYFTSDWHLHHEKVIGYDNRPFANADEMNKTIIDNFSVLTEKDHLFFTGDLSFSKDPYKVIEILKPLKCKLYWVVGNHDSHLLSCEELTDMFEWILPIAEITVIESVHNQPAIRQNITLCHYSMEVWNTSHHGSWHLFGHSHGSLPKCDTKLSFDIGCNVWGYKPLSYQQVKEVMATKTYVPVDHHNKNTSKGTLI